MALKTTLAENKAILRPGRQKTPSIAGDKIYRQWTFVDATVADTLVSAITDLTVTNPQADGQTYTGAFAIGSITAKDEQDRSVTVEQELTLVNTITISEGALVGLPVQYLVVQKNEIENMFGLVDEDGESDAMVYQYKNLNPANATRKACFDATDAHLATLANVATNSPATGWEYADRDFKEAEDGTGEFNVLFKIATWSNVTASGDRTDAVAKTFTNVSQANTLPDNGSGTTRYGIRATNTREAKGVPTDDIKNVIANVTASGATAMKNLFIRDNGNGSHDIQTEELVYRSRNGDFETEWYASNGTQEQRQVIRWFDLVEADADAIITAAKLGTDATTPFATNHVLKSVSKSPISGVINNGNQMFDVVRTTYIPRNGSNGWFGGGGSSSHYLFGYLRKSDNEQVGVESIWTNSITTAETFAKGGDVGTHTKAQAIIELNLLTDLSGWLDANTKIIGYDGSNHTGVRRLGQDMFKATRVWGQSIPWG